MTHKLLLLWDRMGDYHRARWQSLIQLIGEENCYAADLGAGDKLYRWSNTEENKYYFRLSEKPVDQVGAYDALKVFKQVVMENNITHVCIPGYGKLAYILMLRWCKRNNIKVLMFAESWYRGNNLVEGFKKRLIKKNVDICFVSGKRSAQHFVDTLHYPKEQIVEGYSTVDNTYFASGSASKTAPPQLLCVARFALEKNLTLLVKAFKASALSKHWQLRIVGGGPLKEQLQNEAKGFDNILLDDWLSYADLPEMYAQATCFVLPSVFEPWGLVVNEAMSAGLPLILSEAVGAYPDVLKEGENGWLFHADQQKELTLVLDKLNELSLQELANMGKESKEIIANFTPDIWAKKIVEGFLK
ncbi:glycosyltransferase family 4 protein [Labilibacter marinus]|uniref:glycosyltransferase family 4 protein n=1 Tax=Labilibacter marinus TaxID=1477105 RepID=UPI000835D916|nr:glycosyltransferase family 4 protein [Labilibacter marinus]